MTQSLRGFSWASVKSWWEQQGVDPKFVMVPTSFHHQKQVSYKKYNLAGFSETTPGIDGSCTI